MDQILIRWSAFIRYWEESGSITGQYISFYIFNKVYESVRRDILYDIVIETDVTTKLVRTIKMCLNET